jgi:hypothetical protein
MHAVLHAEAAQVTEEMGDESLAARAGLLGRGVRAAPRRLRSAGRRPGEAAALVAHWGNTTDDRLVSGLIARLANALERSAEQRPFLDRDIDAAVGPAVPAELGDIGGVRDWKTP